MQSFLVELGYFLVTLWSNAWRWTLRKRRNLALSVGVVVVAFIVTGMVMQGTASQPVAKPTPTPTPTSTEAYTEVTATPISGGEKTETPKPRPTSTATDATSDPGSSSEAETIARQWATDYLARPSADDTDWKIKVQEYTIPTVVAQLDGQAFRAEGILYDKAPTTVTNVVISEPSEDAETNTPVRWSRTLTATVRGKGDSTTTITFGIVLMKGAQGWTVTSVDEISLEE